MEEHRHKDDDDGTVPITVHLLDGVNGFRMQCAWNNPELIFCKVWSKENYSCACVHAGGVYVYVLVCLLVYA